jgi:hypothetical protein
VYKFVDKGNEEVYSEWIMVPVTTSPVERPINLQVEKSKTTSSTTGYSYDPKNETVISFYAAIPEGETVGTSGKYEFEIAVRGENDEDFNLNYTATPITALSGYEEIAGYRYFVYRIEGLKAGTRYDIKVRVVDKTKEKDKDGDYPKSLYSDQVMLRTEYDEDEANKTAKYEEYLKKYDSETEKLRRQEFWEGDTSTYSGVYKYRESYVDSAFNGQSQYTLATKSGATSVTYYLPKTMLENASDAQSMIEIVLGDYAAYIRPDTLTSSNATVKDMVTEVEKTKYKDYYIVVQMNLYTHTEVVGTAQPVSKEIFLNMSLIPVLEEDRIVEDDIMDALVDQIETYRLSVIKSLEKEMTKEGISEERLTTIIETAVTDIHTAHQKDVARILKNQLGSKTDIDTISKAILLQATLKDVYSATAYYLQEKTWTPKYSFNINGKYSVEADKLGSYIFAGLTSIVSLVPEVPGAQDLITKYQLTTIFNLPKGINNTVTKKQVYDAVSRVLGASLNTDGTVYLQNNGIKGIVSGTASQAMRQDEAIYVIMQAYEKIHHTSVDNLFISNKQAIQNIGAFQTYYRNYVYAAVQLKIVTPENNKVLPSKQLSVKDVLSMLVKITPQ